jgi:hypothetical protein
MNFFDVLFWMGMLCLLPIVIAILRDARSATPLSHRMLAPPAGIEPTSSA